MENLYTLSFLHNNYKTGFEELIRNFIILNIFMELLKSLSEFLRNHIEDYFSCVRHYFQKRKKIEIIGWEIVKPSGSCVIDYPYPIQAISHYIHSNKDVHNLKYFDRTKNNIHFPEDYTKNVSTQLYYMIGSSRNIKLDEHIYLDVFKENTHKKDIASSDYSKIYFQIYTKKKSTKDLKDFLNKCCQQYEDFLESNFHGKLYHFIFQGFEDDYPIFSSNILSEPSNKNIVLLLLPISLLLLLQIIN